MFINFYQSIVKILVRFEIIICHLKKCITIATKKFKIKASISMITHQRELFGLFDEVIDIKSE